MLGGGGGGLSELRVPPRTAANAASKVAKRAHLAASRAVESAVPPRTRSQYFSRNRYGPTTGGASRRWLGSRIGADDDEEDHEADGDGDEHDDDGEEESLERGRRRTARCVSDDSASSVSRSITSSGMSSSDYTTEDDSSEYVTGDEGSEDDDDDDDDEDDDKDENDDGQPHAHHRAPAAAAAASKSSGVGAEATLSERPPAKPPRLSALAAAMEAVSAARARLRQPSRASIAAASPTVSVPAVAGMGSGSGHAPDGPRLPPVVPRSKASTDAAARPTPAHTEGKRSEAAAGGNASLRLLASSLPPAAAPQAVQPPAAAQDASRRSILPTACPSGKAFGAVATAGASSGEKGESMADWVAQRFRSTSRLSMPALTADGATSPPAAKSLPGSGEPASGLRGLLAARSDGAGSWYARPARWHDPLSPAGAMHTSLLDLRPSVAAAAGSATHGSPSGALAPLEHLKRADGLTT